MRKEFKAIRNQRNRFTGIFNRYGTKSNWHGFPETTILLKNITDSAGKVMTDHLWFNLTKGFQDLGDLKEGDIISFDARVKGYHKGYQGRMGYETGQFYSEYDYKLSFPTKIEKVIPINHEVIQNAVNV
jgi:hypothetical protein